MNKLETFIKETDEDIILTKPFLKLEENNKIIGILEFFSIDDSNIELTKILVHPEYRNRGNSVDMINHAITLYNSIQVDKNIKNSSYFKRIGFNNKGKFLVKKS
jgi:N-acetylglutamate synthase-like GNAT family acetyltransferase